MLQFKRFQNSHKRHKAHLRMARCPRFLCGKQVTEEHIRMLFGTDTCTTCERIAARLEWEERKHGNA